MAARTLSVFTEPGRLRHQPRRSRIYGFALFVLVVLALVGVVAVVLLVLGLLNVHGVTEHFRIH
jgi:hypothetical protein